MLTLLGSTSGCSVRIFKAFSASCFRSLTVVYPQTFVSMIVWFKPIVDIEAHTMNHLHLNKLSSVDLDYEIGQSKQCLLDHGINSTIFAYPYSEGSDNSTVVNTVAKYYYLARIDSKFPLTFLHCNGGIG